MGVFHFFLNNTNGTKSRNASHYGFENKHLCENLLITNMLAIYTANGM